MKKIILSIALALLILMTACNSEKETTKDSLDDSKSSQVTTAETTKVTTKAIDAEGWIYFSKDNKEQQEVLALGKEKGGQLEQLYNGFIGYNSGKCKFKTNPNDVKMSSLPVGIDSDDLNEYGYMRVISSDFKTYGQLYDYFCKVCTPAYSTALLTETSHTFKDIDGRLYVHEDAGGFMGWKGSEIRAYKKMDDKIVFNCTAFGDDTLAEDYDENNPVHDSQYDKNFDFTIQKISGVWYIVDCSDVPLLGNTWVN